MVGSTIPPCRAAVRLNSGVSPLLEIDVTRKLFFAAALALALFPLSASAASPYDDELRQLSGELRALMLRADQPAARSGQTQLELYERLFDLSKRLHRLQEEAMGANNELAQSGQPRDRGLTFAAAVADTLDLAQSHTASYLETRDKAFHTAAASAAQSARQLLAAQ